MKAKSLLKSWTKQTVGIAKNIYKTVGGGTSYLKNERKTWAIRQKIVSSVIPDRIISDMIS